MTLKTVERPAQILVGLQIRTKPMSPEIPALWPKFVARIAEIANAAEPRVSYGVMRYEAGTLEYAAAISVTKAERIPAGMTAMTMPAATYAVFSYPLSALGQGFCEIRDRLMPASNYREAPGPFFERYDEKFDPTNPQSAVGIYIPVHPTDRAP